MASQIKHPKRGLANFRPPLRDRVKVKPSAQQRREGNCEKHLALIRQLPCCVTGRAGPNDPHHLKSGPAAKERGVGMRATDKWLVPLCRSAHDELERLGSRSEDAWFRAHGIADVVELAAALWHGTGDVERMTRIVQSHMNRPGR
jgi:hypothetical protein